MDLSYPIYDTALFGTTDNTTHVLFQILEGGDATHTSDFTNARGAGQFPQQEKFTIRKISVAMESNETLANADDWFLDGFIQVYIANQIMLQAPLLTVVDHSGFQGHFTQAVAADLALIGKAGMGYHLDPVLVVGGGVAFKVVIYQGTVVAANNTKVKCILDGILNRP